MENTKICLLSSIYIGRRGEKDKINLGCFFILTKKVYSGTGWNLKISPGQSICEIEWILISYIV